MYKYEGIGIIYTIGDIIMWIFFPSNRQKIFYYDEAFTYTVCVVHTFRVAIRYAATKAK